MGQLLGSLISIHAPIVGCDIVFTAPSLAPLNFNPRTHRGVRQQGFIYQGLNLSIFQSTHPSWGATSEHEEIKAKTTNFNPRTHRGVRQRRIIVYSIMYYISIHAPIVGCDIMMKRSGKFYRKFQSTHPSWGATLFCRCKRDSQSYFNPRTHRGVRQSWPRRLGCSIQYFNPRTHRGVRRD